MADREEDILRSRREKLDRLRARGIDPYPPRSRRTHTAQAAAQLFNATEAAKGPEARTGPVSVVGRITALRTMGKAAFLDIRDGTGRVQAHLRKDVLNDGFELVRDLDLGDFIGVTGPLFRTRVGEITVEAQDVAFLSKALRPPPEKWHGLQDLEKRYRQRYLDLMSNPQVKDQFIVRGRIVEGVRQFLNGRGFVEVDTPILVPVAGGALARPFVTFHNALGETLYLRIATELYLKRLIAGGFDKVYELGRVFRNEGVDQDHNPEFTLLETYEAYADYNDVMRMLEAMVSTIAQDVMGSTILPWGDTTIDFTPPWPRVSLRGAIEEHSGINITRFPDAASLYEQMRLKDVQADRKEAWGRLVDKLVDAFVQPKLMNPTFLVDYPAEMSPLAKPKPGVPGWVERFELFVAGHELANAYSELNDPDLQRQRMEEQEAMRVALGEEAEVDRKDEDYLVALEHAMPPTGGLGVGIERLIMFLTNQHSIRDVLLFPQMRSLSRPDAESAPKAGAEDDRKALTRVRQALAQGPSVTLTDAERTAALQALDRLIK